MAFSFNDLGAKLSKAGQSALQKANEMGDTAKLNMRISELNKSVQTLYARLGEEYFAAFGQAPAEGLTGTCAEIQKNLDEIAQIRQEIQRIRQVKVCPSCGAENPSSTSFCAKCGTALPKEEVKEEPAAPAGNVCPSCGASLKEGAAFCTSCGTRLQSAE